jgi:hypothetical protein
MPGQEEAMEIKFEFTKPAEKQSSTGLHSGMFNDDIVFTFEAKSVHCSDPKQIDEMLGQLDAAVAVFKKSAKAW